ncbi:MAG: 4-hydroxy-4-methyl-2-oxoglutarate aldolase [Alphaproteobacteria bacterium]|nr:4-hydroxy-4-methyl-2-oxoglutarate aldolase [Alphaproteobacteria bacterium]
MQDAFQQLKQLPVAVIVGAMDNQGILSNAIRPLYRPIRLAGPVVTVEMLPGDNAAIDWGIVEAPPGAVLLISCGGDSRHACTGDIHATLAKKRGLAGFVVDGYVRDSGPIAAMGFPVFARGLQLRGPVKKQPGRINQPLAIADLVVRPGDYLFGDDDGLVAVPQTRLAAVCQAAVAREAKEDRILAEIAAGRSTVEINGLAR